ncbi:MAG: PqqD family peptide modification chaperone [Paracoccaceae bacterium]
MNISDTVEKTGKFASTEVGDDLIVFDDAKGEYLGLGETGSAIFGLIDKPLRISAILDQLEQSYDVERATLEADVMPFLEQMLAHDLIRIV